MNIQQTGEHDPCSPVCCISTIQALLAEKWLRSALLKMLNSETNGRMHL